MTVENIQDEREVEEHVEYDVSTQEDDRLVEEITRNEVVFLEKKMTISERFGGVTCSLRIQSMLKMQ